MRYYIIAGERSGDLHAGNLAKAIKEFDQDVEFRGFGGENMKEAGVELRVHYADLAFMGFAEVLANINKISNYIKICKADILAYKPDVVILVDYGGFNMRIAKFAKKQNQKVFYYITPKVWAWYQSRALTLKANIDRMFVILPFEKDFFKKFDWDVDYVGNPVLDAVKSHESDVNFLQNHSFEKDKPVIALLPGSRKQELKTVIPVMAQVAKRFNDFQFGVAMVDNIDNSFYKELEALPNVKFVQNNTYNLLLNSKVAIVTSGTATLETALLKTPQVVIYKTSTVSYFIAKNFIRVPYISLVNLIANKGVVKELIQGEMNAEEVSKELTLLVRDQHYRKQMLNDYENIYKTLDIGSASQNAAKLIIKYLQK
ncbi:lipid-A-disaccharide synthase [Chryseosolibacter indicus]|uniref:Lipid-A-disaccharide synthase n=1 Tax=Chryseosolibacter indicus TaxID=2782351 RepID=A0ABS5W020_9BACT|nr:lipid-A-disaccharide synthase [Chryseosolibacter indicus]MBT1706324.1 lipid-A-disaccharide synthase [Chryseosolibacter indicus]